MSNATVVWLQALTAVVNWGQEVAPRGSRTKEILHANAITLDMNRPVVAAQGRKLNYKFMAAEALWITRGDNAVEPLAKHVDRMRTYSDDGVTLAGAYGPRIISQLSYVVDALAKDEYTRQAVLTIWTPNPAPSKDIPCTVSMAFSIREGKLHCHANMRSSDVWLGVPYDVFSFSMVATMVLCQLNACRPLLAAPLRLGTLTVTATSSHLYESNYGPAADVLLGGSSVFSDHETSPVPPGLTDQGRWDLIVKSLQGMEAHGLDPAIGDGPWIPVRRTPGHQLSLPLENVK